MRQPPATLQVRQSLRVLHGSPSTTATPVITLGSGTYVNPTNTAITDLTSGASIQYCYTKKDSSCTPSNQYTRPIHIDMDQAATQTICANATSSDHPASNTACNHYTAGKPSELSFTYSDGAVTMSTTLSGATIFYTLDGSTATEASIEYTGTPVPVEPGTIIHAAAVQMVSNGVTGVAVQNGQVNPSHFKTVLSSRLHNRLRTPRSTTRLTSNTVPATTSAARACAESPQRLGWCPISRFLRLPAAAP